MKKIIYLICALVSLPLAYSCKEHEIAFYDGADAIFFDQQYGVSYYDSLKQAHMDYSYIPFGVMDERDSLLRIKIEVAGHIRDYDRPFGIEVVADSTTAVAGEDYELLSNEAVILAGQNSTHISVMMHRTPRCEEGTVQLQLRLIPGEHFTLPFGSEGIGKMPLRYTSAETLPMSMNSDPSIHNIFTNCNLRKPKTWNNDNFGIYSETKYKLILEFAEDIFGWTVSDFDNDPKGVMSTTRSVRIAGYVSKYLLEQYKKGREYWVIDEDGSMMWVLGCSWASGTMPENMTEV